MVTCKDMGMQKLANGKALANAAGDSLKHSLLAKNNQLRKVTPQQQRRQKRTCASQKKEWGRHLRAVIA